MQKSLANNRRLAFFLDRDGTLIHDPGYLHEPAKVALLPGVAATLRSLRERNAMFFLFTNQSGPARGLFPMDDVLACNARMCELIGVKGLFDDICIAAEPPGTPGGYRKPSPRFIQESIAKYGLDPALCIAVGDKRRDLESAVSAGIGAVRICADIDNADAAAFATTHDIPTISNFTDLLDIALVKQPSL